jgi:excisionase family DNA binding protein
MAEEEYTTPLVTVRKAAKLVRRGRNHVRQLIEAGEVKAFRFGGTDKRPRLRVNPADVQSAIERNYEYRPKSETKRRSRRSNLPEVEIDPAALAM